MIDWPEKYAPGRTAVHVKNELTMDVKPEVVWAWLVRAVHWPTWYSNSANVMIAGGGPDLRADSTFRWRTFGVRLDSKVTEFAPFERLSWSARAMGIDAYHTWLIEPTPNGCHVRTEETQNGWLAALNGVLRPNHMGQKHQMWLESLLSRARTGFPPPP